jgi:hypothetical protein
MIWVAPASGPVRDPISPLLAVRFYGPTLSSTQMLPERSSRFQHEAVLRDGKLNYIDRSWEHQGRGCKCRRLGDQRVVPCFHRLFLVGMSPSKTPESPSVASTQFLH